MFCGLPLLLLIGVSSAQECSDASNCLDEWKEFCFDNEYSLYMSTKCPKLCGFCNKGIPQVLISTVEVETKMNVHTDCIAEDAFTECVEWKDQCLPDSYHFPWMNKNCKKTCNLCPSEETEHKDAEEESEPIEDEESSHQCMDLNRQMCMHASRYDCQVESKNYEWMVNNCPETCGFCDGIPCKNRFNNCIEEYRPFCNRDHPEYFKMVNLCADFCGFCQDGQMIDPEEGFWNNERKVPPNDRSIEDDASTEEDRRESNKKRKKQRRKNRENKRKNNEIREDANDEAEEAVVETELECKVAEDTFMECNEFRDECHPDALHFSWMRENCAKTCVICQSKNEEEEKKKSKEEDENDGNREKYEDGDQCENLFGKKCNQVSRYYCQFGTKYYDWMSFNCPETCGFCDGITCKNRYSHCIEEYRPFCSRDSPNYITMVNLCADFCGFCKDGRMIDPEEGFPESKRHQWWKGRRTEFFDQYEEDAIVRSDIADNNIPPEALWEMKRVSHHEGEHDADEFEAPPEAGDEDSSEDGEETSPDFSDNREERGDGDTAPEGKKKKRRKERKQRRKNKNGNKKRKRRKNKKNKKQEENEAVEDLVPDQVPDEVPEEAPEEMPEDMLEELTEKASEELSKEPNAPAPVMSVSECEDDDTCDADWKHHCTVESNFFGYMQTYCPQTCGFCT